MDASSSVSGDERAKDGKSKIKNTVTNFNKDTPDSTRTTHDSPTAINDSANHASSKFIVKKLKELYHSHVVEAEKRYHLHFNFCLPTDGEIKDSEFDATPMVLLIGQYSTGKTTFVSHLLGEDFPGMHIGPEPTTDKFMALFYGGDRSNDSFQDGTSEMFKNGFPKKERGIHPDDDPSQSVATDDFVAERGKLVKGNTLTVTPNLPFSSLSQFGSAFLNHFVGSSSSSSLLKRITFIDTPGVLSGEKQRINRAYDFAKVAKWFADRSDLILLLFDAHKLDISDEFKNVIDTIRHYNDDKIRCILNKADAVTRDQLVRVYGSLMWSMGKIFTNSPEVVRVYTGSYWNGRLINHDFEQMFKKDEQLLVQELVDLPRCAAERKVNQMVNRIRLVKVHVCILGTLRSLTPAFFGKKKSRQRIMSNLHVIMENVRVQFDLSKGDMPDPVEFACCLENFPDFSVFPSIDNALIHRLNRLLEVDIPGIVSDAETIATDIRLGRNKKEEIQVQDKIPKDITESCTIELTNPQSSEASKPLKKYSKIIIFFVGFLLMTETAHFVYFKRAYMPSDLFDGCSNIIELIPKLDAMGPKFVAGCTSRPIMAYTTKDSLHARKSLGSPQNELNANKSTL
ncbi:hypothetical protein ACHAWX_001737 [Stephanocyclus meneghinianus]